MEELTAFARSLSKAEPTENSLKVAENRYFRRDQLGNLCEDWFGMIQRVARDIATDPDETINQELAFLFQKIMEAGLFFPNSPTLMNAGTPVQQLQACFVLPIEDSMESIFETLKHSALIQKSGGGVGYFIGKIRHKGAFVNSTGGDASGPLSFISIYNKVSNEIKQGGRRRGASLAAMNYDHPDIIDFIDSKIVGGELSNFNISVRVDNRFMQAVENNEEYDLIDPVFNRPIGKRLRAGDVFERIVKNAHQNGEPGLLFYDAINDENPTPHLGAVEATNPCGEQPLLPYESCNLGSLNLSLLLKKEEGGFKPDWEKIRLVTHIATVFLDRVVDRSKAPIPQIKEIMEGNRKIGLGIMGLAQYLIRQNIPYNTEQGFAAAALAMKEIALQSKLTSWQLADEKGVFPNYTGSVWDKLGLPQRNAATTTVAPTGSLSIFADTSPSSEPLFGVGFARHILEGRIVQMDKLFEEMWREQTGAALPDRLRDEIGAKGPYGIQDLWEIPAELRSIFLCAHDIHPMEHIRMQIAIQEWVDNAVSKTINAPSEATLEDCREAFRQAWRMGAKGITYYRDGSRDEQVIRSISPSQPAEPYQPGPHPAAAYHESSQLTIPYPAESQLSAAHTYSPEQGGQLPTETSADASRRIVVPRVRPETTFGQTTRKKIGFCGKLYVTVNKEISADGEERICEVFTSVGEEGCPPLSNALAKVISISVRAGVSIDEIVENLREEKCPSCIMHPETTVLSCTDFIGQELAKAAQGKIAYRLGAAGGPKNIRTCPSCKIGYMIPDALCNYCENCGYTTCGG